MTLHQFSIMAGALQLGLQIATLLFGLSLVGILVRMIDKVLISNLMVVTEEIAHRAWVAATFMVASTAFTVLHRSSTMLLLLSFVQESTALHLLDSTLFPLAITVLQFIGVYLFRDALLDSCYLNSGEGGGHDY